MLRNEQHLHLARRPNVRARAVAIPHDDHKILMIIAYALASAIILLWMAYLPAVTGSVLTKLNVVQQHISYDSINRLHKGDQLAGEKFADRWNATVAVIKASRPARSVERVPDGCEPAFSRLVKVGNFSARCVAAVQTPIRFASVE